MVGAALAGQGGRLYTEAEMAAAKAQAYQEGTDAARGFASQQLVEFRAEVQALQDGLFAKLEQAESTLHEELRQSLPVLVVDLARRLLAGFEPTAEQVQAISEEALRQVFPEHENLELYLSPADAAMLDTINADWKKRYPGLKLVTDANLSSGDCQVRSRFGLTDARRQAKLDTLIQELVPN